MKKLKNKVHMAVMAFLSVVILFLTSCVDDPIVIKKPLEPSGPETPSELLTSSVIWKMKKITHLDSGSDDTGKYPMFGGYLELRTDGTFQVRQEDNVTEEDSGTWSLSSDGLELNLQSSMWSPSETFKILVLNENTLIFRFGETNSSGGIDIEYIAIR